MRDTPGTYLRGARQMDLTARELATDVEISALSNHNSDAPARAKGPNAPSPRRRPSRPAERVEEEQDHEGPEKKKLL